MKKLLTKFKLSIENKSYLDIIYMISGNMLIKPFQLVKSFVVAKYLGPEEYGLLKSVELIQMLNKFGDLGFNSTVIRDVGSLKGDSNDDKIKEIKSVCYSSELILSFILFLIALSSNFFFTDIIVRYAIIISSIALFFTKFYNLYICEATINREFKFISKLILFQGIFNSLFIIIFVSSFKIFTVLLVPIISTLILLCFCFRKFSIPFSLNINKKTFFDILKTSLKFSLGTLTFGLFRYTERLIIISMIGFTAVGIFGFADTIAALFINVFLTNIKVRKMNIYEYLGKKEFTKVNKIVVRETIILTSLSIFVVVVLIFSLEIFIPIFLDKWTDAIFITQLFIIIIPLKVVSSYIVPVITSPTINKLFYTPILYVFSSIFLLSFSLLLRYFNLLTLINFIYLDILLYCILHLFWIYIYIKQFYHPYVINNKTYLGNE